MKSATLSLYRTTLVYQLYQKYRAYISISIEVKPSCILLKMQYEIQHCKASYREISFLNAKAHVRSKL